jgi:hypothetical protein
MSKSPLQTVKERFKNKEGLLSAVKALAKDELWNDRRLNSDKGLDSVSNKKLLRLHEVLTEVKSKFGSRAKLIEAIAADLKRQKDAGFAAGLERFPTVRLLEIFRAGQKRKKQAAN